MPVSHSTLVRQTDVVLEHPSRRSAPAPVLYVRGVRTAGYGEPERSERVVDRHASSPYTYLLSATYP
eukprot:4636851-Pleurochrysis_carterae.AAC.1